MSLYVKFTLNTDNKTCKFVPQCDSEKKSVLFHILNNLFSVSKGKYRNALEKRFNPAVNVYKTFLSSCKYVSGCSSLFSQRRESGNMIFFYAHF